MRQKIFSFVWVDVFFFNVPMLKMAAKFCGSDHECETHKLKMKIYML